MFAAGLNENSCKTIKYSSRQTLFDVLLESRSEEVSGQARVLNLLSTPQLYYLMPGTLPDFKEEN